MEPIDDYNLIDEDFEEFMRRGRESFGIKEGTESGNNDIQEGLI